MHREDLQAKKHPQKKTGSRSERKADRKFEKQDQKKKKITNREFARVTYVFVALFLVMMGYLTYFTAFKSKEVINSPYNQRQDLFADRVVRGKILDKDGNVLAETKVASDGTETRSYPYGSMYGHVVGYTAKGKSGLESVENFNLLTSNAFFPERIMNEIKEEKNIGDNVVTTLDTELQEAAWDALGDKKGAVFVMEASTGKVLAMVSKPSYNPNTIEKDWESLNENTEGIFVNRVTQGQYAPGSTFKLVTMLEYMRENPDYANYSFECNGEFTYDGTTIHCAGGKSHGTEGMKETLANSCNSSISNMAVQLDIASYQDTAKDLLFNTKLSCVLPSKQSKFQLTKQDASSEVMMTAIGQGKTQVSPYHMALIVDAIANGGKAMEPYLVDHIENYTGSTVKKNMPKTYKTLMTSAEAAQLTEYMKAVVTEGTASALSGQSYTVAGKTGTAEYSSDKEKAHSWFVGFTNVDNPELVISVVIEGADESGARAVNVAKKVFNAYYN